MDPRKKSWETESKTDLLWDVGLNKKSIIRHSSPDNKYYSISSDLSEAHFVGNPRPPESQGKVYLTEGGKIHSQDSSAASVTFATYQHIQKDYGKIPGFDFMFTRVSGQPANYKFSNITRLMNSVKLREVGLVTTHWPEKRKLPLWSFREEYRLNQFNKIEAKFNASLELYRKQNVDSLSYLTCDFRLTYVIEGTYKKVRTDVIGVVFCNLSTVNNPKQGIVYKNFPHGDSFTEQNELKPHKNVILLDAKEMLGLDSLEKIDLNNETYRSEEKCLIYDFKSLIENHLPPPPLGMGYEDAIIVGLDIYSGARGCDIIFNVNDIRLMGSSFLQA